MRLVISFLVALAFLAPAAAQTGTEPASEPVTLTSPSGRIVVRIAAGERLTYDVVAGNKPVMTGASLSMRIDDRALGVAPKVLSVAREEHLSEVVEPPVTQKAARLDARHREVRLEFEGDYAVVFRAYDHGVAYRFQTAFAAPEVTVHEEQARFAFVADYRAFYPEETSFFSHNERHYLPRALADLAPHDLGSLPAVVDAGHVKVAIAEADIEDYPGLWLRGTSGRALDAAFPPYPLEERLGRDRDLRVVKAAGFIARTRGTRAYPWRVLGIAARDVDLITNPLVYLLQSPSRIADTSWIRPGKVAWDWWNATTLDDVGFEAGVNTATYEHYIDFAAAHGLEYVILDEGWYALGNVLDVVPAIDMPAIMAHAREKGVGVILWVVWKTLDDQLEAALDRFAAWGAAGIKVDFMQRDDQKVVDFYHRVSEAAARRHLLVDFHGSLRPALMTRTWPNIVSVEGVRGLEWTKWSAHTDPEHDATLPFTRMFLGSMDYTPGAMVNASRETFRVDFTRPMSLGTRAHQLALYVVFESPLQMLADSPSNYRRAPDAMAFLGPVPTVWDETRVLDGRIADFVVVARRHGDEWYIGALTDWNPREITVDLGFLAEGPWTLDSWADGPDAARRGDDTVRTTGQVDRTGRLTLRLAPGGGFAARLRR